MKALRSKLIAGALLLALILTGALGYIRYTIKTDVNKWCETAQADHPHPNDNVAALLAYVQNDAHSLKERNHVIWAIGQSRDARALPVLEKYYDGKACYHDSRLCQYELEKAIRLCSRGSPNFSGLFKKHHKEAR